MDIIDVQKAEGKVIQQVENKGPNGIAILYSDGTFSILAPTIQEEVQSISYENTDENILKLYAEEFEILKGKY